MAHVEDRWTIPGVGKKRVRGPRYGSGARWLAVWVEPDGARKKRAFTVKDAAQAHIETVGTEKRAGTYITVDSQALTVEVMAGQWVAAHADWAESTHARNVDILRVHVLPVWGDTRLGDVTEDAVQDWVAGMGGAVSTRRRHHQVLSGILTLAVRRKRIAFNPALRVAFPASDRRRKTALTVIEVDGFVAAHPPDWQTWALFLAFTGLRVSEAAGVRVENLDLVRRRVTVEEGVLIVNGRKVEVDHAKTATSTGRRVPLVAELIPLLAEQVKGKGPRDRVFTVRGGVAVNRANYSRRQFRDAIAAVGHPEMTPHNMRHTAVSLAIASGAPVKVVQAIVGHKDATMTLGLYAHLDEADLDVVGVAMEARIRAAREATPKPAAPAEPPAVGV